jgi:hypothetical protein
MTNEDAVIQIDAAIATLTSVRNGMLTSDKVVRVTAGSSLQAAIDAAAEGSVLQLEDGVFAQRQVRITKSVTLTSTNPPPSTRATAIAPVTILGNSDVALDISGTGVKLVGVGLGNTTATGELANITGTDVTFDRVTGLGDPAKGLHRGIRLHGTKTRILKSFFDHIFAFGRDSCVLGGWDGGDDIRIDDCWLCGGAETVMFGGADSTSAERIPRNIRITNSTLTKRPEWYAMGVQIKNAFELKVGIDVYVADCIMEYAGIAEGQGGFPLVFTVRNQSGKAPWSTITNVLLERCLVRNGGGAVNFLGSDNNFTSGQLDGLTLRNVQFENIDPLAGPWKGNGKGFVFDRAPKNVTLDGITLKGSMSSAAYFANSPKQPVLLTMRNMVVPATKYGWKIDAGGQDTPPASKNIQALMPDLTYAVTATDTGSIGHPNG